MNAFIAVSEIVSDSRGALHVTEALRRAGFGRNDIYMVVPSDHQCGGDSHSCAAKGCRVGWLVGVGDQELPGHGDRITAGAPGSSANGNIGGAREAFNETLLAIGIPSSEAARHRAGIRSGGVLVTVHVRHMTDLRRVRAILRQSEAPGSGFLRALRPDRSLTH